MSKFKLGDKAIALENHSQGFFKEGDIYTVDGFTCCPKCGLPCIQLKEVTQATTHAHDQCGWGTNEVSRVFFAERSFEKPVSMSEALEYKLKVSIPELTEIKELQNQ